MSPIEFHRQTCSAYLKGQPCRILQEMGGLWTPWRWTA